MELFATDSNPIPDGAVVVTVLTGDGIRLRAARWPATASPSRGTICLFQGRSECIEKYFETVTDLRRRGFAVATLDWRGQGGSERLLGNPRKGHVDSFTDYDRDFDAFTEQVVLPDCPPPHFGLAHSTGALICLRAAHDGRTRFTRMVLVSPLLALAPSRPSPETGYRIAAFLTAIGFGELQVPEGNAPPLDRMPFADNLLTGDERRFARNVEMLKRSPQLTIGPPTFAWLHAARRAMLEAHGPDFGPAIRVPTLMVIASLDRIVSPRAIEALALEIRGSGVITIAGARHEILMERDPLREQFFAAFDAFVPGSV